jgi:hypothetical protein
MYARHKEDDMEKAFENSGFELVEDTGRRTQGEGDRLMRYKTNGKLVMIDHKSTKNENGIRVNIDQLTKIAHEAKLAEARKGEEVIPILTISFYGMVKKFAIIRIEDIERLLK